MAALDFLLKSAAERKRDVLQDTLSRLREGFIGTRSEGPPTRFGDVPVEGGAFPQTDPRAQFVSQLLTPETAGQGIPAALKMLEEQRQMDISQAGGGLDPVQSSSILSGGVVQIVRRSGATDVVTPEQENIELIKAAEERGAELQAKRAGGRAAATESIKASVDAFKGLKTARDNIAFMDEGIRLLDQGAGTGAVEGRLPSIKAASVRLDNLQARMGLNVIQNTTFGSLSAQELAFALSTALPQGLDAPALLQWMTEKRNAQDKLAKYLEEAAVFLGTPPNTIADFIRFKRQRGQDVQPAAGMISPTTPLPAPGASPPPPAGFR